MSSSKMIAMRIAPLAVAVLLLMSFRLTVAGQISESGQGTNGVQAWVGARIIDGTGKPAIEHATLVIRNGRIEAVGKRVKVPAGAEKIDATGKTIIPGLINAHGHVNREDQLGLYLRDGITTVLSLGGDKEFALREYCAESCSRHGTAPLCCGPDPGFHCHSRSGRGYDSRGSPQER